MKRRLLLLIGIVLSGCSAVETSTDVPVVNKSLSTAVPEYSSLSDIKLPNGRRYVSLGDNEEHAFSVFPRPSRAFPLDEAVPGFPTDFRSKGWETNLEGFGFILHDDKVVLAMHQYESLEPDEFAALLESVRLANSLDRFQATTVNNVDYWYVFSGQDDLIVSRIPGAKKRYQVTVTIGNDQIVTALGILKDVKRSTLPPSTPGTANNDVK